MSGLFGYVFLCSTVLLFEAVVVKGLREVRGNGKQIVRDFGVEGAFGSIEDAPTIVHEQEEITCRDDRGNAVEWFVTYKLPRTVGSTDPHLKEGSAHYFLLPTSAEWQRSPLAINDSNSIIGRTVQPLDLVFAKNAEIAAVLYNDQPPDRDPTIRDGHTKGIMLANSKGGIWMPHSIPHFPIPGPEFGYPAGGLENGQMLLCMSLSVEMLDKVLGGSLQYTKATFYNSSIPKELQERLATVGDVIGGKVPSGNVHYASFELPMKEFKFDVLAKGPKFHREIYADWIAPQFNVDLDVQSWLQGSHTFVSNCTSNCTVLNIMEKSMLTQSFSFSDDHSKWAVSQEGKPLICIADLNRAKPQKGRGGVALCTEHPQLWNAFRSLVQKTQPCTETKPRWHRRNKRPVANDFNLKKHAKYS